MALTGKQVRQLRALAHHLNPVVNVGRGDINDGVVAQTEECLEAHELIKCNVQDGSDLTAREAANEPQSAAAPTWSRSLATVFRSIA